MLFMLMSNSLHAQMEEFEGVVKFRMTILNTYKEQGVSDSLFAAFLMENFGTEPEFEYWHYYKDGSYKQVWRGGGEYNFTVTYQKGTGRLYQASNNNRDTLYYTNVFERREETVYILEVTDDSTSVMGYPCKRIKFLSDNTEQEYWYNSDVCKVDPAHFTDHYLGNYNRTVKEMKSIPLMTIQLLGELKVKTEAYEIVPKALKDKEFAVKKRKVEILIE